MSLIKKNDVVLVLSGREKGKRGKVLKVFRSEDKAVVENVNFIKRHTRANPRKNIKGGILEREAPMAMSLLMAVCRECQQPSRLGVKVGGDGKKARACKKCGAVQE
jgi:large subunit ribosomal protein L24